MEHHEICVTCGSHNCFCYYRDQCIDDLCPYVKEFEQDRIEAENDLAAKSQANQ